MQFAARLIVAVLCLSAVAGPAFAQGGGATTSLSGTVTDSSGGIIPGASVTVKNVATSTQFETISNENGYFSVPALDPGTYSVTVALSGFKTAVVNDVRVNASTPATVKVALEVGGLDRHGHRRRRRRHHPDDDAGGHVDDRHESDPEDPDRKPQRPGVRHAAAWRQHARWSRREPRLDGQRPAAERNQHHHRRHERAGQPPEDR